MIALTLEVPKGVLILLWDSCTPIAVKMVRDLMTTMVSAWAGFHVEGEGVYLRFALGRDATLEDQREGAWQQIYPAILQGFSVWSQLVSSLRSSSEQGALLFLGA